MSNVEERLQQYLAGELSAEDRTAFEDEILANEQLVDQVYEDASLRAALEAAGRARRERNVAETSAAPWWRRWAGQWLVPAGALAVVAVIMLSQQPGGPEDPVFRGGVGELVAVEPMGAVAETPARFVWTASSDAAFYRFELFDAESNPVFETVTADTVFSIEAITLQVPARGYWVVTPLNDLRVRAGGPLLSRYHVKD